MSNVAKVKKEKTIVGLVTMLQVAGPWDPSYEEIFKDRGCNGVQWYLDAGEAADCSPLSGFKEDLTFLRIRSRKTIDDSCLEELVGLKFLEATTRAKNPLNLSELKALSILMIDDRDSLSGIAGSALRTAELFGNRRGLSVFEPAAQVEKIILENARNHELNMAASLPSVGLIRLVGGRIASLSGLVAPELTVLSLDRFDGDEIDLAALSGCSKLKSVSLTPRSSIAVRNGEEIGGRSGCQLITNNNVILV